MSRGGSPGDGNIHSDGGKSPAKGHQSFSFDVGNFGFKGSFLREIRLKLAKWEKERIKPLMEEKKRLYLNSQERKTVRLSLPISEFKKDENKLNIKLVSTQQESNTNLNINFSEDWKDIWWYS